jgi:myosin heavy chain 6/7
LIQNDPSKYFYVAQGMLTIDGIDDDEEMRLTDEAFDILGFTQVSISNKNYRILIFEIL